MKNGRKKQEQIHLGAHGEDYGNWMPISMLWLVGGFPDESFDAVVSNYVYHNITGADKRALLRETLRVLKKGGVFALNDEMKPHMYGDMEAFAQELRDMGYEDVRLIDTAQEAFGSRRRAAMMMLGDSRMLVGRK